MNRSRRNRVCRFLIAGCLAMGVFVGLLGGLNPSQAQTPATPQYGELFLDLIYPAGSTAAFIVTVDRQTVVGQKDISLTIEGLPPGGKGSTSVSLGALPGAYV